MSQTSILSHIHMKGLNSTCYTHATLQCGVIVLMMMMAAGIATLRLFHTH